MSPTKSEAIKDFAFLTLITEETRDSILNNALSIPSWEDMGEHQDSQRNGYALISSH